MQQLNKTIKICRRWLAIVLFFSIHVTANGQESALKTILDISAAEQKAAAVSIGNNLARSNASDNFDLHHYHCIWEIDPAIRYIHGTINASFKMRETGSAITFDLNNALTVDSVLFQGKPVAFSRPGNHTLTIQFPLNLGAGLPESCIIHYQGIPTNGGFGSFTTTLHAGTPVMWTLSQPYGAMDWWPCKNGLNDKTDSIDITLVTPEAYRGISIGTLQNEQSAGGLRTIHWKHRYPVSTYLVAIAATNYTTITDSVLLGARAMPIIQHVFPESEALFRTGTNITIRTIRQLHETFVDYPFIREHYGHTQFSWGGGMEHQTNSFMVGPNETLIVHEAAHQWFGDMVTCGTWKDIWLNEGFATFVTNLSLEKNHPNSTLMSTLRAQLNNIVSQPGGSVIVDDTTNVGRIFNGRLTYTKGAWVVQMLRWKLGDSAFFKGIRNYLNDPSLKHGFARTNNLLKHLEITGGMKLDEFERDWLSGQGYPSYQLYWTSIGNGLTEIELSQTSSHPSVSFFEMPVPIRFKNAQRDTIIVIEHSTQSQNTMIRLPFTPDSAFIDPQLKLISSANTVTRKDPLPADPNTVIAYPNPMQDQLTIFLKNFQQGTLRMILYNNLGQKIWQEQRNDYSGTDILTIPTAHLPRGSYFLQINSGSNLHIIRKLIR